MVGTRSSARLAAKQGSSPESPSEAGAGAKHKTDTGSAPAAKRTKKSPEKVQHAVEEKSPDKDNEGKTVAGEQNGDDRAASKESKNPETDSRVAEILTHDAQMKDAEDVAKDSNEEGGEERERERKGDSQQPKAVDQSKGESHEGKPSTNGDTAVDPTARVRETPSNILEKGIIYFFFRPRVNIDEPQSVNDIQRSYIILRPIPHDASLSEGSIGDAGTNRLFALPKKVLPLSGRDRFMAFVEKAKVSFQTLRDQFLSASEYATKTKGTQHLPAPTPIGEGVYAITSTERESHLAYILTIPSEPGEVQKDIGLRDRGSFIISTRNPEYQAPNNAQLPKGPNFPPEINEEFKSLRWIGTKPHHLDVVNCQVLLIGSSSGLDSATPANDDDENNNKASEETPMEELEKLEHEDRIRVEGMKGDESAAIFRDLAIVANGYSKVQTTF